VSDKVPKGMVITLIIIFLAALIDSLDVSIVTVALPTMANDFGITLSQSSWIMFAYVVSLAALLLPMGKFAKNGRIKRFMLSGTALFAFSSFMCGISSSFWMLIAFRLIQGISAAMMSSVLPSMVVHMLPADRKGLGIATMTSATALAMILGPVLGGIIVENIHWGWLFFINVPICIVILVLSFNHIPKDTAGDKEKDPTFIGGIAVMTLISSLLVMLEDTGDAGGIVMKIVCAVVAIISVPLLIYSIKRDSRRAIISPHILRNWEYLVIGCSFLLCTIVVNGAEFLLPYMLQGYWGRSAFESGIYLGAMSVAMMLLVMPVGNLCDRFGCKWPSAVAIILRSTFCALMIVMVLSDVEPLMVIIPLVIFGASHAFSGTAQPTRMVHHATPGYEDESTNFMLVVNYIASALGCVLFAMVFGMFSPGELSTLGHDSLSDGFIPTMWMSLAFLAIAMVCTLVVKNKIVRK